MLLQANRANAELKNYYLKLTQFGLDFAFFFTLSLSTFSEDTSTFIKNIENIYFKNNMN